MHIVYLCNFDFTRSSGKDRATRQKLEALSKLENITRFKVFSLNKGGEIHKLFRGFFLDIECSFYILMNKPDVFISRGNTGFFSFLIAKFFGILTVREVHALAKEEVELLKYSVFKSFIIKAIFKIFHHLDIWVDIRIFNHPHLLDFYRKNNWSKHSDFYSYNGYAEDALSKLSKKDAKSKFLLDDNCLYLVFTGSVSIWHGVEYLINLQKEFNKHGDNIRIVVGGGSLEEYDLDNVCINITPLDDVGCSELIKAADACLLPVRNNRISPGSPLKLYDYINNNKPVVAEDIIGYSDEILEYEFGIGVNFENTEKTREKIVNYLNYLKGINFGSRKLKVSWKDRMSYWVTKIQLSL